MAAPTLKNFMKRLQKHDVAARREYNPFAHIIKFSSPGLNWLFGNTHGLPHGYTIAVFGPEKSGKTLLGYDMIGQLHQDDPDAIALRFDTEFRDEGQLTPARMKIYGIDEERYVSYLTNQPEKVFDFIEKEVDAMCQDGARIKFIMIDSLSNIQGRRSKDAEGVLTQQRGDKAATIQEGLGRIWPVLHKHGISLYVTTHVRAEQDPVEVMRGNSLRMDGAWFLKHFAGYVMMVEPIKGAAGSQNLLEEKLENEDFKDGMISSKKGEQIGHRIRATMKGSSFGPKNRKVEFTLEYAKGITATHEELYLLGVNRNIIDKPDNTFHVLADWPTKGQQTKWRGKKDTLQGIEESPAIQAEITKRLKLQDLDLMENGATSKFYAETADKPDNKAPSLEE